MLGTTAAVGFGEKGDRDVMDELQRRRKRLAWRAVHRGTREVDLLLGDFVSRHLDAMDPATLDAFEAFLSYPDPQMHAWMTHQAPLPGGLPEGLQALLEDFHYRPQPR